MVGDVASGVARLLRQEVDLARTEIRTEAARAVKGVRSLIVGAMAINLVLVLVTGGGVLALSEVLASRAPRLANWSTAIAAGVVALLWLMVGLTTLWTGRRRLRRISPIPRQTIQSLKEDIAWLRKPNG